MGGLGEMKLMDDLSGDFLDGPLLGVYEHIGLAIKWLANGKQGADFLQRLRLVQQRAMVVMMDTLENRVR